MKTLQEILNLDSKEDKILYSEETQKQYKQFQRESKNEAYKLSLTKMANTRGAATSAGQKLKAKYIKKLAQAIQELVENTSNRHCKFLRKYVDTSPEASDNVITRYKELALITLDAFINCALKEVTYKDSNGFFVSTRGEHRQGVFKEIGNIVTPKLVNDKYDEMLRIHYEQKKKGIHDANNPKPNKKAIYFEVFKTLDMSKDTKQYKNANKAIFMQLYQLGLEKIDLVQVKLVKKHRSKMASHHIELRPEHIDLVTEFLSKELNSKGVHLPSIGNISTWEAPKRYGTDLVRSVQYQKYLNQERIETNYQIDKNLHSKNNMPTVYDFMDIIENVEYTVYNDLLESAQEIKESNERIDKFNSVVPIPPKPPTQWDKNEKREYKYRCESTEGNEPQLNKELFKAACDNFRQQFSGNDSKIWNELKDVQLISKWHELLEEKVSNADRVSASARSLETANMLRKSEVVKFPHNLDTRGRVYPLATSLHPQLNDISKAVLQFRQGCEIDERSLYWMKVNIANSMSEEVTINITDKELILEIASELKITEKEALKFYKENYE